MEISRADAPDTPVTTRRVKAGARVTKELTWSGKGKGGQKLPAGEYLLTCYAKGRKDIFYTIPLTIAEGTTPELPLQVTGAVMPDRSMTDEQLWALMQQPSAVLIIGETAHQPVYTQPRRDAEVVGQFHGGSQCVEILSLDTPGWALVGGWNHAEGCYV